ncbi:MAG: mechanosensitive ion channel domain-containing protein [Promethearchaeota archaeon]
MFVSELLSNSISFDPKEEYDKFIEENPFMDVVIGFVIAVILYIVLSFLYRRLLRSLEDDLSPSALSTMKTLGRLGIVIICLIYLSTWIESSEIATALLGMSALLGTAIGFASQHTLGNLLAGIYLIFSKPFTVRDYVIFPDLKVEGIIRGINVNYTNVLTPSGVVVSIANQKILGTKIMNTKLEQEQTKDKKKKKDITQEEKDQSIQDIFISRFRSAEEEYLYPLTVQINADDFPFPKVKDIFHTVCDNFKDQTSTPPSWFIASRDRLAITIQINVVVRNPYTLLSLTSDVLAIFEDEWDKASAAK